MLNYNINYIYMSNLGYAYDDFNKIGHIYIYII